MSTAIIDLEDVTRTYGSPPTVALGGVTLKIDEGEMVAIVGPSGSGKSTMLNIIGSLDRASSGATRIAGNDVTAMSDASLSALRAYTIGFIFQQFHLSDGVTALDNVATGLLYTGLAPRERRRRARTALERVGLGARLHHHPRQMSGGERQRVAIARAVVGEPRLLLADEPTGSLDTASGEGVVEILHDLNRSGTTVVVITHDQELADRLPRQVRIRDGRILSDDREDSR
ncbi:MULTISPECIES: ABC transporter ATP-binding protein [Oerskovia]|uniref:Macrolide export ATP-binding/permease protein MacB n=1 Tax=Oerskovia enterophila TaxID=43678 RepID=A0ABX2Y7S6_9CELL|nr:MULTISPECIES: ABC transporter ATP-binding protein [Oerskovia]KRC42554.1 ABC transporter ATP-binding protein [Oerskovia sp. Root22]OCI32609.1 macrolide export ATP-binding/permease protein MacB [Oerskovia enterophila]